GLTRIRCRLESRQPPSCWPRPACWSFDPAGHACKIVPMRNGGPVVRAAIVGLMTGTTRRIDAEHSLEELEGLADAAGARVVLRVMQERPRPDSATFLGRGKVELLAQAAAEADVGLVIFDNE